jgi:hypothetical protein
VQSLGDCICLHYHGWWSSFVEGWGYRWIILKYTVGGMRGVWKGFLRHTCFLNSFNSYHTSHPILCAIRYVLRSFGVKISDILYVSIQWWINPVCIKISLQHKKHTLYF